MPSIDVDIQRVNSSDSEIKGENVMNESRFPYKRFSPGFAKFIHILIVHVNVIMTCLFFILPALVFTSIDYAIPRNRMIYILIVMAALWISGCIDISIVSLFPVFLFPMFGILNISATAAQYMSTTNFLFLAAFLMGANAEAAGLHRRLAVTILNFTGPVIHWLLMGIMITGAFLSWWISNTGTTAMLVPFVNIIVAICRGEGVPPDENGNIPRLSEKRCKMLFLALAYSCTIGGFAIFTGTPTNVSFNGYIEKSYGYSPITWANWIPYALPLSALVGIACWLILLFVWTGPRYTFFAIKDVILSFLFLKKKNKTAALTNEQRVEEQLSACLAEMKKDLGPMRFDEIIVCGLFILLLITWFFRSPKWMPGWEEWFPESTHDCVSGILIGSLGFLIPGENIYKNFKSNPVAPYKPILDWKFATSRIDWGALMIFGGGYALAEGLRVTKLSEFIGTQLSVIQKVMSPVAFTFVIIIVSTFMTEFTSNVATINIITNILVPLSNSLKVNPLSLCLPAAMGVAFAFMLPISTPPNAMVFRSGNLTVIEMAKSGFLLNIVSILLIALSIFTWGSTWYDLWGTPDWIDNYTTGN